MCSPERRRIRRGSHLSVVSALAVLMISLVLVLIQKLWIGENQSVPPARPSALWRSGGRLEVWLVRARDV
jgi:hypothetical protein